MSATHDDEGGNGDGNFSIPEVKAIVEDVREAKKQAKNAKKMVAVISLLAVVVCEFPDIAELIADMQELQLGRNHTRPTDQGE